MKFAWFLLMLLLVSGVFVGTAWFSAIYVHKLVHQRLFSYFGINSVVYFNFFGDSYTEPVSPVPLETDKAILMLAHSNNEVVMQLFPFFVAILVLLFVIAFFLFVLILEVLEVLNNGPV